MRGMWGLVGIVMTIMVVEAVFISKRIDPQGQFCLREDLRTSMLIQLGTPSSR